MITIGITGTLGAGKGTIVDYLVKNRGFVHYSVRAFLTEEIKRRGLEVNRDTMAMVGNDLRAKHTPSYIVEELYKHIQSLKEICELIGPKTAIIPIHHNPDADFHTVGLQKGLDDKIVEADTIVDGISISFDFTKR